MSKPQSFVEKCYKNPEGRVVLAQRPNLPLYVWLIATIMTKVFKEGSVNNVSDLIAFGAIFTWAWLELIEGDAYIRRALGLIVLVLIIASRI